jgi:hypothetical protein
VLLSHDKASGLISLRHYSISTAPSGIKKSLKALLAKRALPGDMGALRDVSELVTKSGYGSVRGLGGAGGGGGCGAAGTGFVGHRSQGGTFGIKLMVGPRHVAHGTPSG